MTATSIERNTEKFIKLPLDYQEAIKSSDYDNALDTITKEHKLHIDQSAELEYLLAKLIFGEIKAEDMISKMENVLNISNIEATKLATELNQKIIKPIKENLKDIQTKTQEKEDVK